MPNAVALGRFLQEHTAPDELILSNDWQSKSTPVQYYAKRDNFDWPDAFGLEVATVEAVERSIRARPRRRFAFVLTDEGPGSGEIGAWLSSRYPAEEVSVGRERYRIFHIPAEQPAAQLDESDGAPR